MNIKYNMFIYYFSSNSRSPSPDPTVDTWQMDTDSLEVDKLDKPPPPSIPKSDPEQSSMVKLATKLNGTVVSTKPLLSKGEFLLERFLNIF